MSDIAKIETDALTIPTMSTEQLAELLSALAGMKERIKEAEKLVDGQLIERIKESGPFILGTVKYYVGKKKTTKCVNVPGAMEALLTAVGGDWEKFTEFMASQPVKYGAAKGVLDSKTYAGLFETTEEDELKEGSAGRLLKADTRFMK